MNYDWLEHNAIEWEAPQTGHIIYHPAQLNVIDHKCATCGSPVRIVVLDDLFEPVVMDGKTIYRENYFSQVFNLVEDSWVSVVYKHFEHVQCLKCDKCAQCHTEHPINLFGCQRCCQATIDRL